MNELTNVTTGEVRLSYVRLFKPFAFKQGQEEKFSCTVLIPKTDVNTLTRINNAIAAATEKGVSDKWNGFRPPIIPNPVHDGDGLKDDGTERDPECKGHWVINASAKADRPPEVVDANLSPIINQSEIYSGIYGKVCLSFFPYEFGGKKGIGCSLEAVQKLRDGEPLGGNRITAAQAFGAAAPATPAYGAAAGVYGGQAQPAGYTPQYSQPVQPAVNPITGLPF